MSEEAKEPPRAFIQWKGTEVCMDVECECGASGHVDGEFVYSVRCVACGRKYSVGDHVPLTPQSDVDWDEGSNCDFRDCRETGTTDMPCPRKERHLYTRKQVEEAWRASHDNPTFDVADLIGALEKP